MSKICTAESTLGQNFSSLFMWAELGDLAADLADSCAINNVVEAGPVSVPNPPTIAPTIRRQATRR